MGREKYFALSINILIEILKLIGKRSARACASIFRPSGRLPPGAMVGLLLWCAAVLSGCSEFPLPTDPVLPDPIPEPIPPIAGVPSWQDCTRSSNWRGFNARDRVMNVPSPKMPDAKFREYIAWAKSRGCNTAHMILANKGDGEYAGYCIYGSSWDWTVDAATVATMRERIAYVRAQGLAYVPWLFTDDSSLWTAEAAKDFPRYLRDLKAQGLLDQASLVVVGLELPEYYAGKVKDLVAATRAVWPGKIGTHETSGSLRFAALADIVFYQVSPGKTASWIKAEAARVVRATGKPLNFFELARGPDRALAQAALDGGAYAVGNW
ncbi:MAG: hypothetical protein PHR35_11950 [Kiritimatiellae bacterium]|nr:hypothetical protein [Kiritimatiellia bacterium]